jgi:antitoxin YefM
MEITSYTEFRNNLAAMMDKVNNDHAPVLITRQNGLPAILMSYEDFQSYDETAYLMSNPEVAKKLQRGVDDIRSGNYVVRDIVEP